MKLSRMQIRRLVESVLNEEEEKKATLDFEDMKIAGSSPVDIDSLLKNKKQFRKFIKGNRFNPQNNPPGAKSMGATMVMLANEIMGVKLGDDIRKECEKAPIAGARMLAQEIAKKDKSKAKKFVLAIANVSDNILKNPDDEQAKKDFISAAIDQMFK